MLTTTQILLSFRDKICRSYSAFTNRRVVVPAGLDIPDSPEDALKMGMLLGRQQGYEDGLVVGTELGLDVGLQAVDAMLSQPVIFGNPVSA